MKKVNILTPRELKKKKRKKLAIISLTIIGVIGLGVVSYYTFQNYYVPPQVWKDREMIYEARKDALQDVPFYDVKKHREVRKEEKDNDILSKPKKSGAFKELDGKIYEFYDNSLVQEEYEEITKDLDEFATKLVEGKTTEDDIKEFYLTKTYEENGEEIIPSELGIVNYKVRDFYMPNYKEDLIVKSIKEDITSGHVEVIKTFYDKETEKTNVVVLAVRPITLK